MESTVKSTVERRQGASQKALNATEDMTILVSQYIERCIGCHRCMDACPATKGTFTIEELNEASKPGTKVPQVIAEFAFNCMQCGKCIPVCPVNIHRDSMVLYVKHKLRKQKPYHYSRYLLIKGRKRPSLARIAQGLYIGMKKMMTRDLARFMETSPQKKTDVVFYPGCYLYSTETVRRTLRLLDAVGCSYSVLGGVTACCGAPHRLQGEFAEAERCLELLHQKVKTVNPQIVITACAECFEEMNRLKTVYHEKFEVQSVAQYLLKQMKTMPKRKIRGKIVVHDSCRFSKSPQESAAQEIAAVFGELVDASLGQVSSCCALWNHGNDPGNAARRRAFLRKVKEAAPTLACNCLTCYEELKKGDADIEIIDVLQLFEEALDATPKGGKKK